VTTTRTKPIRIFTEDHDPVRLVAEIRREAPAAVLHQAWAEYLVNHRDELLAVHEETQRFLRTSDVAGLRKAIVAEAGAGAAGEAAAVRASARRGVALAR
jgi:hypothetical protein